MKLGELINKMNVNRACAITISGLCEEYREGVEELKKEDWYKSHRNDRVYNYTIIINGHIEPELVICTVWEGIKC